MTTITELVRGTESVRDRADSAHSAVRIEQSRYAAGTKTLMLTASVTSETKSNSKYTNVIVFQGVEASQRQRGKFVLPFDVSGTRWYIEKPKAGSHNVRVRCSCVDYVHTWAYWNNQKKALFGSKYPPYSHKTNNANLERNKKHEAGLCKHLLAVVQQLRDSGIVRR
jgi:hypothetical protein